MQRIPRTYDIRNPEGAHRKSSEYFVSNYKNTSTKTPSTANPSLFLHASSGEKYRVFQKTKWIWNRIIPFILPLFPYFSIESLSINRMLRSAPMSVELKESISASEMRTTDYWKENILFRTWFEKTVSSFRISFQENYFFIDQDFYRSGFIIDFFIDFL